MEDALFESGFLNELSPNVRDKLLSLAQTFRYGAGETIFLEGSPSDCFYVVKVGFVKVDITIPSRGRRSILSAGPGEVVSWSALVRPRVHHASAHAAVPVELLGIPGETLAAVCDEDPKMGYEVYKALAETASARLTATRLQVLDIFAAV